MPVMINISESGMLSLLPQFLKHLISHSRRNLRRVYPKGLRVTSANQNPLTQWQNGSQIVCLNLQKYDTGVQLNEALFVGTPGWVLKPAYMRGFPEERPKRVKLLGHVYGGSASTWYNIRITEYCTNGTFPSALPWRHYEILFLRPSAVDAYKTGSRVEDKIEARRSPSWTNWCRHCLG